MIPSSTPRCTTFADSFSDRLEPELVAAGVPEEMAGTVARMGGGALTQVTDKTLPEQLAEVPPLEGLVDVQAELLRIEKLMARESADLERSKAKMNNRKFVDNAPPEVVAQEQQRLSRHEANMEQFRAQGERLESLRN